MKISAFAIYRFYRNGLPALTRAALVCIVLFGILAFVIFSPGLAFEKSPSSRPQVAVLSVAERYVESGIFQDSEPLFLPTSRNFGASEAPKELSLNEEALLPFGEMLFLGSGENEPALALKTNQVPAAASDALGADAWEISTGFGTGTLSFVDDAAYEIAAVPVKTRVRVENANSGELVFNGILEGVSGDAEQILLAPTELLCGIASGYGLPRVVIVSSCGDIDRDRQIEKSVSALLSSLSLGRGVYRIFVDLR